MAGILFSSRAEAKFMAPPGARAVREKENEEPVNAKDKHKTQLQNLLSPCKEITWRCFVVLDTQLSCIANGLNQNSMPFLFSCSISVLMRYIKKLHSPQHVSI